MDFQPGKVRFPTTHWSALAQVRDGRRGPGRGPLDELLERYWQPMHLYLVLGRRLTPDKAAELLQEFCLEKFVHEDLVDHADRARGRFRTFLLSVLDNFVNTVLRSGAERNRVERHAQSLDDAAPAASAADDPAAIFDAAWARQVLAEAVELVAHECEASDRPELWQVFEQRQLNPNLRGDTPTPYRAIVEQGLFASEAQAANALVTVNRMFRRKLREVLRRYSRDDDEVEQELAELKRALARQPAQRRLAVVR